MEIVFVILVSVAAGFIFGWMVGVDSAGEAVQRAFKRMGKYLTLQEQAEMTRIFQKGAKAWKDD